MLLKAFHDAALALTKLERRIDPFFRPAFDALLREPLAAVVQLLINLPRRKEGLRLAEEKLLPGEEAFLDSIIRDSLRTTGAAIDRATRMPWPQADPRAAGMRG